VTQGGVRFPRSCQLLADGVVSALFQMAIIAKGFPGQPLPFSAAILS
jgi:hypothetical protein